MRFQLASCTALMAVLGALASTAYAQDPNAARSLAATCFTCHGTDGMSTGGIPSIAGQNKDYLLLQLKEFKAGKRPATIMHQQAKGYSDEQLEQIAGYFAAVKPAAKAPAATTPAARGGGY